MGILRFKTTVLLMAPLFLTASYFRERILIDIYGDAIGSFKLNMLHNCYLSFFMVVSSYLQQLDVSKLIIEKHMI